jgi:hypothetical protein
METETTQQTSSPTAGNTSGQPPPDPVTPESLREELEKHKVEQEKLTQKNAASIDYVAKSEKATSDVAKAIEDYKKAYDKQLLPAKQEADRISKCESDDATSEIGVNKGNVEAARKEIDDYIKDTLEKNVDRCAASKSDCEQKFSDKQKALAEKQADLQSGLNYPSDLAAKFKAITELEGKVKKVNDHAHPAEFYFYTADVKKLLGKIELRSKDEFAKYLTDSRDALETALRDVIDAKGDLIDASVDLDVAQKQLADGKANREAKILEKIKQYDQPVSQPSSAPGAASAR